MADILRQSLEQLAYPVGPWIEETRVKLGEGYYGAVHAVKIRGLQCAGKKFDPALLARATDRRRAASDDTAETAGQVLVEQCLQLAEVRHPNVVQLLGVLLDGPGPTLVSEVLPFSLAKCLDDYQHIPAYAKSSVLLDVANGLRYAHELKRAMVHGRLCPEKVLLTVSLQAKICGFVNPSRVTLPDSSYTAPELAADGSSPLTTQGDVFAYGNLVLHLLTQQYPQPTVKELSDPANPGHTVTCSEAERREASLREIGETHTLRGLVRRCLEDDPGARPSVAEVLQEVEQYAVSTPPPYASILQVMQEVEQAALVKENLASLTQTLEGKQAELDAKQLEVEGLTQELEVKEKAFSACKEELDAYRQTVHSKERRMQMHDQALRAKDSLIKAKAREIAAKDQQLSAKDSQLAASSRRIATLEERLTSGRGHSLRYPSTPQRSPTRSPAFTRSQQVSPTFKESPYKFSHSAEAEDLAVKAGEVLRRTTPGRRGKTVPMSDGWFFQNKFEPPKTGIYGQQPVDPKLASILAKRHQRYAQIDLEPGQQTAGPESTSDQVQLRRQAVEGRQNRSASASNAMSPELQKLMNKRRSLMDVEVTECAPMTQPKPEPPPTAPRRRQGASPMEDHSPAIVEQPPTPQDPPPPPQAEPVPAEQKQEEPSSEQPSSEQTAPEELEKQQPQSEPPTATSNQAQEESNEDRTHGEKEENPLPTTSKSEENPPLPAQEDEERQGEAPAADLQQGSDPEPQPPAAEEPSSAGKTEV